MLFNVLTCLSVLVILILVCALTLTFINNKWAMNTKKEDMVILMNFSVWSSLIIFMWIMSWQNWWR